MSDELKPCVKCRHCKKVAWAYRCHFEENKVIGTSNITGKTITKGESLCFHSRSECMGNNFEPNKIERLKNWIRSKFTRTAENSNGL